MNPSGIYHEKQDLFHCALHTLNNLFQDKNAFGQADLDEICFNLAPDAWPWLNPHKAMFGLGNYDVNVITAALQLKGYELIWFDKRKDPNVLVLPNIFGFIFNVPSTWKSWLDLPNILGFRHWYAVRDITVADAVPHTYYKLDSKSDSPETIGLELQLKEFLREELASPDKQLFVVVSAEVASTGIWER